MEANLQEPYDASDIASLHELIKQADTNSEVRHVLLCRLGFIEAGGKPKLRSRLKRWIFTPLGVAATSFLAAVSYVAIYPRFSASLAVRGIPGDGKMVTNVVTNTLFATAATLGTYVVAVLGFWIGYTRWELAEKNRNVDDTIKRKELANKMMVENAAVLLPYVGDAFDVESRYAETQVTDHDRIKVQMYVFTEIDNLEFVFDKVKSGLIQELQALRAIKILLARCENDNFERMARRLLERGRYNTDFVMCVRVLLNVAHWTRSQTFPESAGAPLTRIASK